MWMQPKCLFFRANAIGSGRMQRARGRRCMCTHSIAKVGVYGVLLLPAGLYDFHGSIDSWNISLLLVSLFANNKFLHISWQVPQFSSSFLYLVHLCVQGNKIFTTAMLLMTLRFTLKTEINKSAFNSCDNNLRNSTLLNFTPPFFWPLLITARATCFFRHAPSR